MAIPASLAQMLNDFPVASYPSVTGLPQPITVHSITYLLAALGWAWLLLISFTGWGRIAGRTAHVQKLPASVACAVGIATVIFWGGLLNLLRGLYPGILIGLLFAGLIFYGLSYKETPGKYRWRIFWRQASPWGKLVCVAAIAIFAFKVAGTVRLGMFNNLDDGPAYLVFAHKLLANHSFAFDPFSDRRVISSLGGAYLLQAMAVAGTSLASIGIADRTIGFFLLGAAIYDIGIAFELSASRIALLEFLAILVPQQTINLSFIILPTSLFLAMIWLLLRVSDAEDGASPGCFALLAGITGGAILSLKSTFLPCVGMFSVLPYFFLERRRRYAWRYAGISVLACFLLLLPWMLAMRWTSGTFLFPVFGHGVDYSSYGLLPPQIRLLSARTWAKIFLQAIALGILAVILIRSRVKSKRHRLCLGILIAAAIAITAFNYKTGGDFIWRYNFPQFFAAVLIFYAATGGAGISPRISDSSASSSASGKFAFCCGVAAVIAMIFYYDASGTNPRPFREVRMDAGDYRLGLRASLTGQTLANPQLAKQYRQAESSIPLHANAIENTAYPFLFSYRDRTIFLADWPGGASPPPGWPFRAGQEPLSAFLRRQSIRYLIYDNAYARWVDMEACIALENTNRNSQELVSLWHLTVLAHRQFNQLQANYRSIYDDGQIAVIDLQQPLPKSASESDVWTVDTPVDTMCSEVQRQYLKNPLRGNGDDAGLQSTPVK